MAVTSSEKGKLLEHAVRDLENIILKKNPKLNESQFHIEINKIYKYKGVKHEIDLYVTVKLGDGYDSVFIFECKNRKKKSDKNDITIFSNKIDITSAQKGYFITKTFTSDAKSQAELDDRLELIVATNLENDLTGSLIKSSTRHQFEKIVSLSVKGLPRKYFPKLSLIEISALSILIEGKRMPFGKYLMDWAQIRITKSIASNDRQFENAGTHHRKSKGRRKYASPICLENLNILINELEIEVGYSVEVVYPTIISNFDIASRGRIIRYDLGAIGSIAESRGTLLMDKELLTHANSEIALKFV